MWDNSHLLALICHVCHTQVRLISLESTPLSFFHSFMWNSIALFSMPYTGLVNSTYSTAVPYCHRKWTFYRCVTHDSHHLCHFAAYDHLCKVMIVSFMRFLHEILWHQSHRWWTLILDRPFARLLFFWDMAVLFATIGTVSSFYFTCPLLFNGCDGLLENPP